MDRTQAHSAAASLGDLCLGAPWMNYILGLDLPLRQNLFIFNISPGAVTQTHGDKTISGSADMASLFGAVMSKLQNPAAIYGWCGEPESFCIERLAQFGHYHVHTATAPNLSFHAGVPPLSPPPYHQDTAPKIAEPQQKCYITFVQNEGDTATVLTSMYYRA